MSDPMGLLALDPEDYATAVAVVNKASKLDGERRQAEYNAVVKALVEGIGNAVAARLAPLLKAR